MYMRQPSDKPTKAQRKKDKKDKKDKKNKLEKKIKTPSQVISQKVVVNIGDKVKAKSKRKARKKVDKLPPQAVRPQPQFIYPTNPTLDLVGQISPPPPQPLKPPIQVPQFTPRSLNEQVASVASQVDIQSREDIPSRKELKAKAKEKVPVSFEKVNDPNKQTAYDRVRPQLGVGRDLLNEVVDEMMKDVAKEQLVEPSVRDMIDSKKKEMKKEEKIDVVVFDPRTKPLVQRGQSRFFNITPQEVSKKLDEAKEAKEAKERVDKRSQPLQKQSPANPTLGQPDVESDVIGSDAQEATFV